MTDRLKRRVAALETTGSSDLSPHAKAWLGWPLTPSEQAKLAEPGTTSAPDLANLSPEARRWLGQPAAPNMSERRK